MNKFTLSNDRPILYNLHKAVYKDIENKMILTTYFHINNIIKSD